LATIINRIKSRNKGICGLEKYLENLDSYEQMVESSLFELSKETKACKSGKRCFFTAFSYDLIDKSAENLENDITKRALNKKV